MRLAAQCTKTSRLWDIRSNGGVDIPPLYFIGYNIIAICHTRLLNGGILVGDPDGVNVLINVSLDLQLSRLLVNCAKITGLYWAGKGSKRTDTRTKKLMEVLTRILLGGSQLAHFLSLS
jgi:hypothetical protein